jgi:hypothetical protein
LFLARHEAIFSLGLPASHYFKLAALESEPLSNFSGLLFVLEYGSIFFGSVYVILCGATFVFYEEV